MRINMKKILVGLFAGFFSRMVYHNIEKVINNNQSLCNPNDQCSGKHCSDCFPTKVEVVSKLNTHLAPAYKPKGMYEVTRWLLVDENYVYDIINEEPKVELKGVLKEAVKEATSISLQYINLNRMMGSTWSLQQLQNGYVRTDSKRGSDYILDLKVTPNTKNLPFAKTQHIFRVHLVHPFQSAEDLQLKSIKETTKTVINIVIPLALSSPFVKDIIDNLDQIIQEKETKLTMVLFDESNDHTSHEYYDSIIRKAQTKKTKISIMKQTGSYDYHDGIQKSLLSFHSNDIVLIMKEGYSFTDALFEHCRAICAEGRRVYFPVPFAQYHPKIIENGMPPGKPKNVYKKDHTKFTGQWAHKDHDTVCGFKSDIFKIYDGSSVTSDGIYEKFLRNDYETFMAVEPNLYKLNDAVVCEMYNHDKTELSNCYKSKTQYLGSKPALGILYIKEVLQKT